jgi:hypothetical protein
MNTVASQLDKSLASTMSDGYGTITIRVVVLEKASVQAPAEGVPADAEADEALPEQDRRPTAGYLEEPKRGRQCCVFLINGQRQHAWDNAFIIRDLELKYLRNRMIVIVDVDGLKPESIAELMQGSRHQFYEGKVYDALATRVISTLKGDPDLIRLEAEAEDEISSLQAGDEVVKAALDQLIQEHHDMASHVEHGHVQPGEASRQVGPDGKLLQSQDVVVPGDSTLGASASGPFLAMRPDVATIRLKPKETRKVTFGSKPEADWGLVEKVGLTFDPPVKELRVAQTVQINGSDFELNFDEPEGFDEDEYPIETTLRAAATFRGYSEPRLVERRVVINRPRKVGPRPTPQLQDEPTYVRVTSRQPVQIIQGGPDVHVKLRWDGKDSLATGTPPAWVFRASCDTPAAVPAMSFTSPVEGRLELLVQSPVGVKVGDQLKFTVEAVGPAGKTLTTAFLGEVVVPPGPRKITARVTGGAQRRPPYELKYVHSAEWDQETCWAATPWTKGDPGCFQPPSSNAPLTLFINQDMELLASYRDGLLAKQLAESTIQERITKYTSHVAFHLYQMHTDQKARSENQSAEPNAAGLTEDDMREEIRRVATTLIRLMEVSR